MATAKVNNEDSQLLHVLMAEYDRTAAHIQELVMKNEKHAGMWIGLTVLLCSFGFAKDGSTQVFFIVPFTHIMLLYYVLSVQEYIFMAAGYAASIEGEINGLVKKHALRWESQLSPKHGQYRRSHLFLSGFVGAASLSIWVASFFALDGNVRYIFGIEIVVLLILGCPGFWWYCNLSPLSHTLREESASLYKTPFVPNAEAITPAPETLKPENFGD